MLGYLSISPSGNIISSDINSINNSGVLFVYGRDFSQACYLEGNVTDALTNSPLTPLMSRF